MAEPLPVPTPPAGRLGLAVVLTASATLVYELTIGTLSTYLNGDSALQYSLTIGAFLAAMGLGAFAARGVQDTEALPRLLWVEIASSLLGGLGALGLYAGSLALGEGDLAFMLALVLGIGTLAGMELPMLAVLLQRAGGARHVFASALALDYMGSLIGALAFPFVLLPTFGAVNTAAATGLLNLAAVLLLLRGQPRTLHRAQRHAATGAAVVLTAALLASSTLVSWFEHLLYRDEIVHAETTRFQRIVVASYRDDLRLYSDGELQFSSRDEHRYHEALVHPLLAAVRHPESVLVIGGGDGLTARELLKDVRVRSITLVDIDPRMTEVARTLPALAALNRGALSNPRVRVLNVDGYRFVGDDSERYDAIVVDLPDPRTEELARLYSREFYLRLLRRLAPTGALVTQAGSPYYTRESYWTTVTTLRSLPLRTISYRVHVPSFGEWGFVLASRAPIAWESLRLTLPRRYLDARVLRAASMFDAETSEPPGLVPSTFAAPTVWRHYRRSVRYWRN